MDAAEAQVLSATITGITSVAVAFIAAGLRKRKDDDDEEEE